MAKHGVIRTDNMAGTDVRAQLVSVKYMGADGDTPTEIDNGNVLAVGGLVEGEREIFVGTKPTAGTKVSDIVVIATPEVFYDSTIKKNLDEYTNEAGKILRGYRLHSGGIYSVTAEALSGVPAKDTKVTIGADTKLVIGGEGTEVGQIIAEETAGRYKYFVIKIN